MRNVKGSDDPNNSCSRPTDPGEDYFIPIGARLRSRPLQPAAMARQETRRGTVFEADLVAQLPVLRRYAGKLTHDLEDALDLLDDTCERARGLRPLFPEGTG